VKAYYLKENYKIYGSIRSFSSGYVKLRANNFGYLKDLRSELQTISDESSVDSARRITRAPNPNRILCLVKRIFTIYGESDLDAKINQMNDLLSEDIWRENQEMGDRAKIALDKLLRNEYLGEEVFCIDEFFIKEGISLEGLRAEDLTSKIESCQSFYREKFLDLQENLKEWNEEKNNLLLQEEERYNLLLQEEEFNKDKGKQPDLSLHPYYISEDGNTSKITQKEDFNLINYDKPESSKMLLTDSSNLQEFCVNDELPFNLANKRKFSDFNGLDICDEGKILKKVKISHNTSSLLDDFADISCEPLDIIDFDG
jgi:hypothetical protein